MDKNDVRPMSWEELKILQGGPRLATYQRERQAMDLVLNSDAPEHKAARAAFTRTIKAMTPGQVHVNRPLSNLAIAYANEEYIGDLLIPEVKVEKQADSFYEMSRRDFTAYPSDNLSVEGEANKISRSLTTQSYLSVDHGYKESVPLSTIENQDEVLDEFVAATENTAEGLAYQREARQVTLLTTAGNYSGNTTAVSTGWSTGGTPIADVQTARAAIWQGAGPSRVLGFCSLNVYNILAKHSTMLAIFRYGPEANGLVTPKMIANVFGLDDLLVGKAWKDTANIGQSASYSRMWGDVFGIVRVMKGTATRNRNAGFAARFTWKRPSTKIDLRPLNGVSGGYVVQTTSSDIDKVVGAPTGYLLTNVGA
jgi:hypothetical protein